MSEFLSLYRGDSFYNSKTNPGWYRSNGITSSALGAGGDPMNIEKITVLTTIKRHIEHKKKLEKEYFKISDYLSFSESEERAKQWASGHAVEMLIPSKDKFFETRYVFKLQIDFNDLKEVSNGVFEYRFVCNTLLRTSSALTEPPELSFAIDYALQHASCQVCNSSRSDHLITLICPRMLLEDLVGDNEFVRAYEFTKNDKEWLVLPNDFIDSRFRSTMIPPANFWTVDNYNLMGEEPRNPYIDHIQKIV